MGKLLFHAMVAATAVHPRDHDRMVAGIKTKHLSGKAWPERPG
jgi:hypothetical protein